MRVPLSARSALALLMSTALAVGVTACSQGGESSKNQSGSSPKNLVVYSSDPGNAKQYQPLLDEFGKANGVSVQLISYPSADFIKNFTSAVAGNSQIDALLANGQDVRYLKSKGLLADITGAVDPSTLVEPATKPFTIDGKLYAAGIGTLSTTAMIYNKDLLAKYGLTVPKTFADLKATAAKLKGTGVSLISVPGGNIYLWPMWFMQTFQQATGDTPVDTTMSTLSKGSPAFDSTAYVAALTALKQLGTDGVFGAGYNGVTQDAAVAAFVAKKSVMFYGGSWDLSSIVQQGASMNLSAMPFPTFVEGVTAKPAGGVGIAAGVYGKATGTNAALARKLVTFISSAKADTKLVQGGTTGISLPSAKGVQPSTKSPLQAQIIGDFVPVTYTFLDWYWPKQVTSAMQNGIQAVVAGKMSPEDAAKDAQNAFTQAKSEGWTFN